MLIDSCMVANPVQISQTQISIEHQKNCVDCHVMCGHKMHTVKYRRKYGFGAKL